MARIRQRVRADGGTTYQVCWVIGGGRAGNGAKEQYESFTNRKRAESFRLDVEVAGHQWPTGWVKGQGYAAAIEPDPSRVTLDDVAARYWEACKRRVHRGKVQADTLHKYKRNWALHLEPVLGGLPFADITVDHIEDWVDSELDAGSAPKSIRNWHGTLHSVMQHGQLRENLRPDNPCLATDLPEVDHRAIREIRFFTKPEWAAFRKCLNADVLLLCDYLLATGARWGEVSALRVGDMTVNRDGDVVAHIVRAWKGRAPDDTSPINLAAGESQRWKLGPPKNRKTRYVVVTGDIAKRLAAAIKGRLADEYVFLRRAQPWRYEGFHVDRWTPAVKAAGIEKRLTPHMLRHTCVVWSLAEGVKIEQVSEMLGHASIQITYDIYGGLLDLRDPTVARAMATAMAGLDGIADTK